MKVVLRLHVLALLALGWMLCCPRSGAQSFGVSVANSPNPVPLNSTLTYLIGVTNVGSSIISAAVTNVISGPAQITAAYSTNGVGGLLSATSSNAVFVIEQFIGGTSAQLAVTVQPTGTGSITNTITIVSSSAFYTNVVTNVVNAVTNTAGQADLALTLTRTGDAVITNDYIAYGLTVTNSGPDLATGVVLSNSFPAGVVFKTNWPGTLTASLKTASNAVFNLGTLTNGAVTNITLRVQPTNAGTLSFWSSVTTTASDTNSVNNTNSLAVVVYPYSDGTLIATNVSATQVFDPLTGLMEQVVRVVNAGTNPVSSVRLVVSGLNRTNWLYNATGTNSGDPFVVHGGALGTNESVDLLMQYFVPSGLPFAMSTNQLNAYAIPQLDLTAPASRGTPVGMWTNIVQLPTNSVLAGGMLMLFPSLTNRTYLMVYSDNVLFSNAYLARPSIVSLANWTYWVDFGPPETISHPTKSTSRFYRVYLSP